MKALPRHLPPVSAKGWPEHVTKWIQSARGTRRQGPPVVMNPAAYTVDWWKWWDLLQPQWRVRGDDRKWITGETYNGEWDDQLLHWGTNGLLSVVASLYFWGCAIAESVEGRDAWEIAVNNVAWILEGLAVFHESFKRHNSCCTCILSTQIVVVK
jgi:hypothetical protein